MYYSVLPEKAKSHKHIDIGASDSARWLCAPYKFLYYYIIIIIIIIIWYISRRFLACTVAEQAVA